MNNLCFSSAAKLSAAIRKKELGAAELTAALLNEIERYDGGLRCVCEINERALDEAKRLDSQKPNPNQRLYGLPVLIKDNIDVAGLHTAAGSVALADNIAERSAPIIDNIVKNGGIILGKTNMTEFANFTAQDMPNGFSSRGGQVKNAYGDRFDAGGSSSGSAVAVSAGFCPLAVGTDTSFSVVGCAAQNGVAGYKPPHGALPAKGIVPISSTLDSAGALARSLSDAVLLYSAMKDADINVAPAPVSQLKIAVNTFDRDIVSEQQLSRYDSLIASLKSDGAAFDEISQPKTDFLRTLMLCEFKRDLESYLAASAAKRKTLDEIIEFYDSTPDAAPYGISLLKQAAQSGVDSGEYRLAAAARAQLRETVTETLSRFDACIMTGPTNIMHFAGIPSLALGMCMGPDGAPRGIILYGAEEKRLISAALSIEKHCAEILPPKRGL